MPRCAAEHSHGRVELRTERQVRAALPHTVPLSPKASALRDDGTI